jgi:hypothetical protein
MRLTLNLGLFAFLLALAMPYSARAGSQLLFGEAQFVGGYSSRLDEPIFYSMDPDAEMQKPSVGFDYLGRFSANGRDWGAAAVQARLALDVDADDGIEDLEPQLYNAWLKVKLPLADIWLGHNRPAFGIGSYLDSHGLLLRTLSMQGFGYDRDWGGGIYRDFSRGNLQLSATTGSGMPLYNRGNYMLAARAGLGVLNEDNWTAGLSGGYGRTLETMGYELHMDDPMDMRLVGADLTFLRNNLEHRVDILTGTWMGETTTAAMYRLSVLLDPEDTLRVEAQPSWWASEESGWQMATCVSYRLSASLTLRTVYEYDHATDDHRVIVQLYEYKRL